MGSTWPEHWSLLMGGPSVPWSWFTVAASPVRKAASSRGSRAGPLKLVRILGSYF
jgi:hypothetical protein